MSTDPSTKAATAQGASIFITRLTQQSPQHVPSHPSRDTSLHQGSCPFGLPAASLDETSVESPNMSKTLTRQSLGKCKAEPPKLLPVDVRLWHRRDSRANEALGTDEDSKCWLTAADYCTMSAALCELHQSRWPHCGTASRSRECFASLKQSKTRCSMPLQAFRHPGQQCNCGRGRALATYRHVGNITVQCPKGFRHSAGAEASVKPANSRHKKQEQATLRS